MHQEAYYWQEPTCNPSTLMVRRCADQSSASFVPHHERLQFLSVKSKKGLVLRCDVSGLTLRGRDASVSGGAAALTSLCDADEQRSTDTLVSLTS